LEAQFKYRKMTVKTINY